MQKFTLTIALAGMVAFQGISQDLRIAPTTLPHNAGKTFIMPHTNGGAVQPRGGMSAVNVAYTDDFSLPNDTDALKARGYIPYYRGGGPQGTTATWYQGAGVAGGVFGAYNGADIDYVAANYNVVTGTNDIDSWLVLPALNIAAGDMISFYSQSILNSIYPDSIKVMYSAVGDSTPEDLSWVMLGEFVVNIIGVWELQSFAAPAAGTSARFAIRYSVIDGGPTGANSNYIGIDQLDVFTPATLDGGVSAIAAIAPNCAGLSATEAITVTITNFGASAISNFSVSYSINGGAPVTETYTGTINGGATANYTFTQTANLSALGAYTITASTTITGDTNAGNDGSSTGTVSGGTPVTLGSPFSEGFETGGGTPTAPILPLGWTEEDTDGDGNMWDMPATYPHNGTICARIGFGGGAAAATVENWIFTPCLDLAAGTNYVLEYWYKSFDGTLIPYSLESRIGTTATSAGMTTNIGAEANPTDSSYHLATHPFTVPANGTYYIGWNGYGTGVQVSMRFDDAAITVITGVEENTLSNTVSIYPNPAADVINITCKMRGAVKVEIVNAIGQLVHTTNYTEPFKTQVNMSNFSKGIYTVKLTSDSETLVQKVVLQNN